ncbi:glucose-6-phosphate isomerase, partial [Rhodococcus sp. IITR03]
MSDITATAPWKALEDHRDRLESVSLRQLFTSEPERVSALTIPAGDLVIDFSKQRFDTPVLQALLELADTAGIAAAREAMFSGAHINVTEDRAVLHTALR